MWAASSYAARATAKDADNVVVCCPGPRPNMSDDPPARSVHCTMDAEA